MPLHWKVMITAPKSNDKMLETKASLYEYGDMYRVCFKNSKQAYYFEFPMSPNDIPMMLEIEALKYFNENRNSLDIGRCVRCSKWHVISGQLCERCKKACEGIDLETTNLVVLEIEV